jgi:hypothetical protein
MFGGNNLILRSVFLGRGTLKIPQFIDPQNTFLSPIHIKLTKDFVSFIDRNREDFQSVVYKFPWISTAKYVTDVIIFGPQIMAVTNDKNFDEVLHGIVNPCVGSIKIGC